MGALARRREHRSLEVQAERHARPGHRRVAGRPRRQRGRGAPARRARDHRRHERRHAVARRGRRRARRCGRGSVVTSMPWAPLICSVDEPGHDPPAAGVDVDRRSRRPTTVHQPTVDRHGEPASSDAVGRQRRRPPPTIIPASLHRHLAVARRARRRGCRAGRRPGRARRGGRGRGRRASATSASPRRASVGIELGSRTRRSGPRHPAADGDDVDVERHHAQLYRPRRRRARRRGAGSASVDDGDRAARADRLGTPDLPAAARRAVPIASARARSRRPPPIDPRHSRPASTKPAAMPVPTLTYASDCVGRQPRWANGAEGGGVDVVLEVHGHADRRRTRSADGVGGRRCRG